MKQGKPAARVIRILCAGQRCPERERCMRYQFRGGYMRYASFDLERERLEDRQCPAFERI